MILLQYGRTETRLRKWISKQPIGTKFFSSDISKEFNESPRTLGRVLGVLVREEIIRTDGRMHKQKYRYEVISIGA